MSERLSDCLVAPAVVGMALTNLAFNAAKDIRHSRDLNRAQAWVDHLAASAQAADQDFRAVVAQLAQARREAAMLRDALDQADQENLDLTMEIRSLKARTH